MKKIILSIVIMALMAGFSAVAAQPPGVVPAGAGDKNLGDDAIKTRSIEMERMKREAEKQGSVMNSDIASRFSDIKKDFEAIQIAESAIIKAYTTGEKIDYKLLDVAAQEVSRSAKRLDQNLFAAKVETKKEKSKGAKSEKPEEEATKQESLKEIIMQLDKHIGEFVSSKMFQNLLAVDVEVAQKSKQDLTMIIKLSNKISKEAAESK